MLCVCMGNVWLSKRERAWQDSVSDSFLAVYGMDEQRLHRLQTALGFEILVRFAVAE